MTQDHSTNNQTTWTQIDDSNHMVSLFSFTQFHHCLAFAAKLCVIKAIQLVHSCNYIKPNGLEPCMPKTFEKILSHKVTKFYNWKTISASASNNSACWTLQFQFHGTFNSTTLIPVANVEKREDNEKKNNKRSNKSVIFVLPFLGILRNLTFETIHTLTYYSKESEQSMSMSMSSWSDFLLPLDLDNTKRRRVDRQDQKWRRWWITI